MSDQKNTIIAVVLSAIVLIAWQYFVGMPQMEKQRQEAQQKAQEQQVLAEQQRLKAPPPLPGQVITAPGQSVTREQALGPFDQRIKIETPRLQGSIALKGARIDDLALAQ